MSLHLILVDSRPGYLGRNARTSSLLLLPIGKETLVEHLAAHVRGLCASRPVVVPPVNAAYDYGAQLAAAAPEVRVLASSRNFDDLLGTLEPSDTVLIVDPRTIPADGLDPLALLSVPRLDPRWAVHYVSVVSDSSDMHEYADIDAAGRVRRVRRWYDGVTSPFISGVTASVLPVSALLGQRLDDLSLKSLRSRLAARGVASCDLQLATTTVDLHEEAGLLALVEQNVRRAMAAQSETGPLLIGGGHRIHATARLVGPVVVHSEAVVEERAIVMGPAVICAGAHIGPDVVVAQSVVGAGCVLLPGTRVQHRAVFDEIASDHAVPIARPHTAASVPLAQKPSTQQMPTARSRYMAIKHVADTLIAAATLILISPVMLLIALAVALDSDGPIFYLHEREGLRGRPFRCIKFRSMHVGAQALERELHAKSLVDGPQFKLKRDPRVTRVGKLLRLANLDELPQLINVVRGEMALVGPRPSPFSENQLCVPWRQGRLSVRPGITGLWQVCRHDRSQGDFQQWIEFDLLYVRHMSWTLDVRILLATVIGGGGQRAVSLGWVLPAAANPESHPTRAVPV